MLWYIQFKDCILPWAVIILIHRLAVHLFIICRGESIFSPYRIKQSLDLAIRRHYNSHSFTFGSVYKSKLTTFLTDNWEYDLLTIWLVLEDLVQSNSPFCSSGGCF